MKFQCYSAYIGNFVVVTRVPISGAPYYTMTCFYVSIVNMFRASFSCNDENFFLK